MAVLSSVLLLGSILLSFAENGYALSLPLSVTQTITAVTLVAMASGMPLSEQTTRGVRKTDTPTVQPDQECIPPVGYIAIKFQLGDTLSSLAEKYSISENAILKASCIDSAGFNSTSLRVGSVVYVPQIHPTSEVGNCSNAPYGWRTYSVKYGQTLFELSLVTNVTVSELQEANCLGKSTDIKAGQMLHLPFIP
jgi:LysM repeat protein